MTENEVSYKVRGAIFSVYNKIGPGLLETAYEAALYYELIKMGLNVRRQVYLPFTYKDVQIDVAFRLDMIVEDKVILELKSVESLAGVHYKQLLTYLRLTNRKLGLLINFNTTDLSTGIVRVVNGL